MLQDVAGVLELELEYLHLILQATTEATIGLRDVYAH